MNLQDCRRILQVPPGAGLDEVKAAFRRLAFRLHPDLNPSPKAAEQFRELNEAYVLLSHSLKDETATSQEQARGPFQEPPGDARARKAKAEKAYARSSAEAGPQPGAKKKPGGAFHFREEEVLRDLLSDPFARQVFEDIYSQLKQGGQAAGKPGRGAAQAPFTGGFTGGWPGAAPDKAAKPLKRRKLEITWGDKSLGLDLSKGIVGGVKSWLRGQLDDEQTVSFPAHALGPGKTLRLTVSSRFGEPRTVEVTLPPDFVIGRPVRLRGLGRKLGPFIGDLFLRVLAK